MSLASISPSKTSDFLLADPITTLIGKIGSQIMLYRGVGAPHSPNVPFFDIELEKGLARLGFNGKRRKGGSVFASTDLSQASDYALTDEDLFVVEPKSGSYVTFVKDVKDLVLDFQIYLREVYASEIPRANRSTASLLADVQGDISIIETYLYLGRQKKNIALIVDAYLSMLEIKEIKLERRSDIEDFLRNHDGEVCITGDCDYTPYEDLVPAYGM